MKAKQRLDYLRNELRAEQISYGELVELQSLVKHIAPDEVELLEAAGIPEHPRNHYPGRGADDRQTAGMGVTP